MSDANLNWVLDQLAPLRHRKTAYLIAAGFVIAAAAAAAAAQVVFRPSATLIFAAAVVSCTGLLGLTAGLLSAVLGALVLDYFFIAPLFAFNLDALTARAAIELCAIAVFTHFAERRISASIRSRKKLPLGIRGELDGIVNGEAYGWAMDCDHPSSPVIVTISVDHRPVAEAAAVYYRPDLETRLQCSGSYGFFVDLRGRVFEKKDALIEARTSDGQVLKNSPQTATIPIRGPQDAPAVLFMHIPKTAGIAFREAITPNYRESAIAYVYGTAPGFLVGDLRRLPLEQRRNLRFVIGHFQYGIHDDLPQETLYVTILREPTARMLSQYGFLQQTNPALLREGNRTLKLEELLERKRHIHFDNALVRHFAGVDEREFPAGSVNQELYDKALYYARTGFAFIGHQEFAADAYAWLKQRFGWNARPELQLVNLGPARVEEPERAALRTAMERYNHWDCQLYQEILRIFPYPYAAQAAGA
jgi:hypothetical protein